MKFRSWLPEWLAGKTPASPRSSRGTSSGTLTITSSTFTNNKATLESSGQVTVSYTGTVCGIPVSGTETVKK